MKCFFYAAKRQDLRVFKSLRLGFTTALLCLGAPTVPHCPACNSGQRSLCWAASSKPATTADTVLRALWGLRDSDSQQARRLKSIPGEQVDCEFHNSRFITKINIKVLTRIAITINTIMMCSTATIHDTVIFADSATV